MKKRKRKSMKTFVKGFTDPNRLVMPNTKESPSKQTFMDDQENVFL